jgi:hypothetical protein
MQVAAIANRAAALNPARSEFKVIIVKALS